MKKIQIFNEKQTNKQNNKNEKVRIKLYINKK